jgi:hypothetical protein
LPFDLIRCRFVSKKRGEPPVVALDLQSAGERHDLSPEVWAFYAQAAAVAFERYHSPPPPPKDGTLHPSRHDEVPAKLTWSPTDERARRSHEALDATCSGAYAVACAAVDALDGWRVIGRTDHGSGSDWYMIRRDARDPDAWVKLEVSGIGECAGMRGMTLLRARLRQKVQQVEGGDLDRPGVAVVVGFEAVRVLVSEVQQ